MKRNTNTGYRPGNLADTDMVMVLLNSGNERGPWIVSSRHGAINWIMVSPDNPAWPFTIKEWWRA
jgi:hypothetical protein